eukprot:1548532-Amphidinium_carterae.1
MPSSRGTRCRRCNGTDLNPVRLISDAKRQVGLLTLMSILASKVHQQLDSQSASGSKQDKA